MKCQRSAKFFVIFWIASFCGCGASSLSTMTATGSSKVALLQESVGKFEQSLYWGSLDEAMQFVKPGKESTFFADYKDVKKKEKLVDMSVEGIEFAPDGDSAQVDVKVRYYKVPTYLIQGRIEKQVWEFQRYNGGWLYRDRTVEKLSDASS